MADIHGTIDTQRNALERVAQRVPGFRGYFDKENRREADKLLRDYGARLLDHVVSELHEATKRAELGDMDGFQELVNHAEKLRNELRHADRGYAGFFSEIKWDHEEMLDAIYAYDAAIVEKLEAVDARVAEAEFSVTEVRDEIRALSRSLTDRRSAILGLAGE